MVATIFRSPRGVPTRLSPNKFIGMLLGAMIFAPAALAQSSTIFSESFASGTGAFTPSGRVYTGSYGVRLRGELGEDGFITSSTINAQGYSNLVLSFDRETSGLDSGEAGIASVSINNGPFTTVESVRNASGNRVSIPLAAAADNSSLRIRFSIDASSFFETYEVDEVILEGSLDDDDDGGGGDDDLPGNLPPLGDFVTFESGHVRPLALSSDGQRLYAVNTPDNRVEIFDVSGNQPQLVDSVRVGLEPVALALRDDGELWVVNHLSDSVSIVNVAATPARVTRTLLVGDEPRDVIFAGANNKWAFITAAHRGQNAPFDPQLTTEGIGRADVWVFSSGNPGAALGGQPATILNMFGDSLRALARNTSGSRVYAAVLHSGNRSTVLTDDIGDGGIDKASPVTDVDGETQPATGLIVQYDGSNWVDAGDPLRNVAPKVWNDRVNLNLPDYDVFTIDTTSTLPQVIDETSGVGTTLFNLAVNPVSGKVYVSNQEALNLTRFEGMGTRSTTVNGHFVESRITVIDNGQAMPRHLNKHINYNSALGSASERQNALAIPLQMALSPDGNELFVTAMGSNKLARFDTAALENNSFTPSASNHLVLSGGGPTGVVLDAARDRAFVMTRYDNGISVVDTTSQLAELAHVTMFNPEPAVVKNGRRFLYDANYTSSRGDSSCAGCHIFGDMDHLAWDLGDPDGSVARNPADYNENIPFFGRNRDLHPMKGPMTTQSLRGLVGNGPMHWRGDRTGQSADFDESIEEQAFEDFNVAFTGLLRRADPLSEAEMDAFAKFALELSYPPNPIANLDNSLTPAQSQGMSIYNNVISDNITTCNGCHRLDPNQGQFGTDGTMAIEGPGVAEDMKIPHLRNMYQKVGMFARNTQTNFPFLGDQIRGFGFDNSGASGSVFQFLSAGVFTLNDADTRLVEQVALAFPSEMNPIVGQQVTVSAANRDRSDVGARLNLLVQRALVSNPRPECELVASAVLQGESLGWVMNASEAFVPSNSTRPTISLDSLLDQAESENAAVTFTCAPPGNGTRIAVDRDGDGVRDADES